MDIPARAVLDSGVLFTVLTLNYVQRSSPPEPKRTNVLRKAIDAVIFESEERQSYQYNSAYEDYCQER